MTGKMNMALTVTKADAEILRVLDKTCYLITKITVATDDTILLDIESFTNSNDALNKGE